MSDNRPDLPDSASSNFGQKVRETLMTYLGRIGDPLDKGITARDLIAAGVMSIKSGFSSGGSSATGTIYQPGTSTDLSMPPTPTNFAASAGITSIVVSTDAPTFTNGHGYLRTRIYGATWVSGPLPVFASAVRLTDFTGAVTSISTNPSTTWRLWATWESNDGVESNPAGGTNGLAVTTGADVSTLLTALTGQITESQLYTTLNGRINLIDGPSTLSGSVAQQIAAEATARGTAITTEQTIRSSADSALATSISLLTAGVAGGFDIGTINYFDSTTESWTASGATIAWNNGWVDVTSTGTNPQFISPTISIAGGTYPSIQARIKRIAGTGWTGTAYYSTSGHGFSSSYKKTISMPASFNTAGDVEVITFDMTALTAGGSDWTTSTITGIRLDLGSTSSDVISVDWVGIGRQAPGASQAGLLSEQSARVAGDTANATSITALSATVTSNNSTVTAAIASEATTRASADSALSSSISSLSSTVTSNNSTLTGLISSEASTRAAADSANASAITTLQATVNDPTTGVVANSAAISTESTVRAAADSSLFAQYTVKIDTNGYVSGFGLASTTTGATPTSSFIVRSDSFSIASPSGPGVSPAMPFIVRTTSTTIGGVTVPIGVYLVDGFIQNGTITNAKIANATIDTAKIASLAADKIVSGSISTGTAIQSTGFISGTTGFYIDGTGNAEFNNAVFRGSGAFAGSVTASSGAIGGITITSTSLYSGRSSLTTGTGFYLNNSGLFAVGNPSGNQLKWDGTNLVINSPQLNVDSTGATFNGTLNVASATSGARLEIKNNVIKVFDSGGTLRVRIGDLTA